MAQKPAESTRRPLNPRWKLLLFANPALHRGQAPRVWPACPDRRRAHAFLPGDQHLGNLRALSPRGERPPTLDEAGLPNKLNKGVSGTHTGTWPRAGMERLGVSVGRSSQTWVSWRAQGVLGRAAEPTAAPRQTGSGRCVSDALEQPGPAGLRPTPLRCEADGPARTKCHLS